MLVLREMAQNAPTLFYPYVSQFFENIWVALRDSKVVIREGAADALRACLELISQRESQQRAPWYQNIYDEYQKGLKQNTPESIHGSLLAIKELLTHTGTVRWGHFPPPPHKRTPKPDLVVFSLSSSLLVFGKPLL